MLKILSAIIARIVSNSFLNVFQKIMTNNSEKSSVVNFFSYLGLSLVSVLLLPLCKFNFSLELILNFLIMGILGALGNYFIIKALSLGELSSLAPINSYKPIVAMIFAFIYLKEVPTIYALLGILFIIFGTYILNKGGIKNKTAVLYRFTALIFSGAEAVFIKKIILLTNLPMSFVLWAFSGLIFSFLFVKFSGHQFKIKELKPLLLLVSCITIMQYSTNYVFSRINVAYALALFQLSALVSVFLGVNIFHEKDYMRKIVASTVMIIGAAVILLN